jgi:hypothetical protein
MPLFYACLLTPDKQIPPLVVVYLGYIALSIGFQGVRREAGTEGLNFDGINGMNGIHQRGQNYATDSKHASALSFLRLTDASKVFIKAFARCIGPKE